MATGGEPESVDSRVTCSICLEPYRGRQPKLLPCFHTFCLPCLTQLTDSAALQRATQVSSSSESSVDSVATIADPVIITCPTCRAPQAVPPGGAAALQTNFYIQDDTIENAFSSTATSYSRKSATVTSQKMIELQTKAKDQIKILETMTSQLSDDVAEISQQREAVEKEIQARFTAGLQKLAEARDLSLISLRQAAEQSTDQLLAETSTIDITLTSLRQLAGEEVSTQQSSASALKDLEKLLLTEAAIRHFSQRPGKKERAPVFSYSGGARQEDDTTPDCFQDFMGTVTLCSLPVRQPSGRQNEQQAFLSDGTEVHASASYAEMMKLRHDVTALQTENARLWDRVESASAQLKSDVNALQKDVTRFGAMTESMEKDAAGVHGSLQKDVRRFGTLAGRLEKEAADLRIELMSLQKEHGQRSSGLQDQVVSVEQDVTSLKTAQESLATLTLKLQAQIDKVSKPVFFNAV